MPESARNRLLTRILELFATQGVADTSLRGIATGVGTSHRMLIHHFGSRDGLLRAVVDRLEQDQRDLLDRLIAAADAEPGPAVDPAPDPAAGPVAVSWLFWTQVSEAARRYGPLFYELSAHAMQGRAHAASLRHSLVEDWIEPLARLWQRAGVAEAAARRQARLDLAVARGLLQDLLLTGEGDAVDQAMRDHVDATSARILPHV